MIEIDQIANRTSSSSFIRPNLMNRPQSGTLRRKKHSESACSINQIQIPAPTLMPAPSLFSRRTVKTNAIYTISNPILRPTTAYTRTFRENGMVRKRFDYQHILPAAQHPQYQQKIIKSLIQLTSAKNNTENLLDKCSNVQYKKPYVRPKGVINVANMMTRLKSYMPTLNNLKPEAELSPHKQKDEPAIVPTSILSKESRYGDKQQPPSQRKVVRFKAEKDEIAKDQDDSLELSKIEAINNKFNDSSDDSLEIKAEMAKFFK